MTLESNSDSPTESAGGVLGRGVGWATSVCVASIDAVVPQWDSVTADS
jgi:hypothetical protein